MKRNNKGISMISLIVVIISIIILAAIAITAGYRYINESKESEKTALASIISEAAYRRQNDYELDSSSYYAGSSVKESDITTTNFKNLPINFESEKTRIQTELGGTNPIWFVLDGESAKDLGVDGVADYDNYLIDKFSNMTPADETHYSPVALVEYITGSTYLVEVKNSFASNLNPTDHDHVYSVATCFEPMTCKICGHEEGSPIPHLIVGKKLVGGQYEITDGSPVADTDILALVENHTYIATCTQALMCKRCETVFAPATGHDFPTTYTYDATKHWIECLNGCGTQKEVAAHTKVYISVDDSGHIQNCYICGWESAKTPHEIIIVNVDNTHHRRYCTLCDYDVTHEDDGWHSDRTSHWKECDETGDANCGDPILKEGHKDENNDYVCDVCGRYLDNTPPIPFGTDDIVIVSKTTHQIEVRAHTTDDEHGQGIAYYEFSIDNGATWNRINVSNDSQSATYKYENLYHNQDYTILVRVVDKSENVTEGSISTKTYEVPAQAVVNTISPEAITNGTVTVTLSMPEISLPQVAKNELKIVYKIDGVSSDWVDYTGPISVTREQPTVVLTKIVDKRSPEANSSRIVSTINVTNIDKTPPTVTVEATNSSTSSTSHEATIRIQDSKAGIAAGTTVQYAWSTSSTTPPTSWQSTTTGEAGKDVTVTVTSPSGVEGTYYLWVRAGVQDAVGNATTSPVTGGMSFVIDDVAPTLTVRTMRNQEAGVIDQLYVKTNSTITVNITSNKKLSQGPLVRVDTKEVRATATSTAGTSWVAEIEVDASFTEGLLDDVEYSDYISYSGKPGATYTTNTDSKYITYDRTLPQLDYVNKGG